MKFLTAPDAHTFNLTEALTALCNATGLEPMTAAAAVALALAAALVYVVFN